eukprot:TRINITY_DN75440_c0_g1_i1.p1 TRINITY_DN75440_c0_g1~~TRINITY_DN75440_c0_g1_i1.p1  ORF type:complete len:721 (+),score=109.52 TRINITY_DN75440_c0_g1_i1:36-2198(+)
MHANPAASQFGISQPWCHLGHNMVPGPRLPECHQCVAAGTRDTNSARQISRRHSAKSFHAAQCDCPPRSFANASLRIYVRSMIQVASMIAVRRVRRAAPLLAQGMQTSIFVRSGFSLPRVSSRHALSLMRDRLSELESRASISDEATIDHLNECTSSLQDLCRDWGGLDTDGHGDGGVTVHALQQRHEELRTSLGACPLGNPADVFAVSEQESSDPATEAFKRATHAIRSADLARSLWAFSFIEIHMAESSRLAGSLLELSNARLRLHDVQGAHADLVRANELGEPMMKKTTYLAQLLAPRDSDLLMDATSAGSRSEVFCRRLQGIFHDAGYRLFAVPALAKRLEEEPTEEQEEHWPPLLKLIAVFWSHCTARLAHFIPVLGLELCQFLLRLRVLTVMHNTSGRLISPDEASRLVVDSQEAIMYSVFSNVQVWPVEEDLLVATDWSGTFYSKDLQPVMYLSDDSWALASAAPRHPPAGRVLDLCCGSGVQGIVALRYYAERGVFVDLNPRAIRFTSFNLALNGLSSKAQAVLHGNLYEVLPSGTERFGAIVANPPFLPNPGCIADGAGAMFGDGGSTGESVISAIVRGAATWLVPGGRLSTVSLAPDVEEMPARLASWYFSAQQHASGLRARIFHGPPGPAPQFIGTASAAEAHRLKVALETMGIRTMAETLVVLEATSCDVVNVEISGPPREALWSDHEFMATEIRNCLGRGETEQGSG